MANNSGFIDPKKDILLGAKNFQVWFILAMNDIKQRYARSILGPIWLSLSTLISILVLSILYSMVLNIQIENYPLHLCIGIIVWSYINSIINDSSQCFIQSDNLIKHFNLPLSIYVYRSCCRNVLIFLHNLPIILCFIIYYKVEIDFKILLAIFGFFLISFLLINISIVISIVSSRFRDFPPLLTSLMQISFFITPVLWTSDTIILRFPDYKWILDLNPFYHIIEIIRSPLMGNSSSITSWLAVLICSICSLLLSNYLMRKYRYSVIYWI